MKATEWQEAFGLTKEERARLTHYYVLHYGTDDTGDMVRMVSGYFGDHHSEAVRLHNMAYGSRPRYNVCYITTSKEKVES
jgi:hypothetical protein